MSVPMWDSLFEVPREGMGPLTQFTADADAAMQLLPPWVFRTFETPKDMILGGGCYGVDVDGVLATIAYVADKSVKYARVGVMTAEPYRRRGYAFAAVRKLMETCVD